MDNLSNDTDVKEIINPIEKGSPSKTSMKFSKNMIIIVLASLLFFSFLGVNIFHNIASAVYGFIARMLSVMGFYTGAVINTAADVAGDTAKGGVDIAEGTIHSLGNLLQNEDNINGDTSIQQQWNLSMFNLNPAPKSAPKPNVPPPVVQTAKKNLDEELNNGLKSNTKFSPSTTASSGKKWCPVGYSNGSGKCIQIDETDKCMFGKVFDTERLCEDEVDSPPFKGYASQEREINWGRPPPPPPPGALTPPYQPQMFNDLPGQSCNRMPSCSNLNISTLPIINKPVHYAKPMYQSPFPDNNSANTSQTPPYRPESNYSNQSLPISSNQNNNNNNPSRDSQGTPSNNNASPGIPPPPPSNNTANFNNNNYTPLANSPDSASLTNSPGSASLTNSPGSASLTNSPGSASFSPSTSNLTSSINTLSERVDELSDVLTSKHGSSYSPSASVTTPAAGVPLTATVPPAVVPLTATVPPAAGVASVPPVAAVPPATTGPTGCSTYTHDSTLEAPSNINMWLNNSVIYIIGKGVPGSTIEMSQEMPFNNFLPSNTIANANGDFQSSINSSNNSALFNKILGATNAENKVRAVKDCKSSSIITFNTNNFNSCYFNNPAQNNAKDMASFTSSLSAANEYCVNTLNISSSSLSQSYPSGTAPATPAQSA